jgi:hypothetical protein
MSQHVAQENLLRAIVDLGDQPVRISFYVEYCEPTNRIGFGKHALHVRQAPPFRFLGYPVPDIEGAGEIAMPFDRLQQLLSADNMHELCLLLNSHNANMSMVNFADCELPAGLEFGLVMRCFEKTAK